MAFKLPKQQSGILSEDDYKAYGITPPEQPGFGDFFDAVPAQYWFQLASLFTRDQNGMDRGLEALGNLTSEIGPELKKQKQQEAVYKNLFGPQQAQAQQTQVAPNTPPEVDSFAPVQSGRGAGGLGFDPDMINMSPAAPQAAPPRSALPGEAPQQASPSPPISPPGDFAASSSQRGQAPPSQPQGLLSGMGLSAEEQRFYAIWMMSDPKEAMKSLANRQGGGSGGGDYYQAIPTIIDGQRAYVQPRKSGGWKKLDGLTPPPTPGVQQQQGRNLKDLQTGAAAGSRMMTALGPMEKMLEQNNNAGLGFPEVSMLGRGAIFADEMVDGVTGVRPLESMGVIDENTRKQASIAEQLDSLSKTLGIELLTSIGGNDTERELLTAIETAYNPRALPESNLQLVRLKKAAAKVAMDLPGEYARWINQYQSEFYGPLVNEGGKQRMLTWPEYWKMRQQEIMRSMGVQSLSPDQWDQWYLEYAGASLTQRRDQQTKPKGPDGNVPDWAR